MMGLMSTAVQKASMITFIVSFGKETNESVVFDKLCELFKKVGEENPPECFQRFWTFGKKLSNRFLFIGTDRFYREVKRNELDRSEKFYLNRYYFSEKDTPNKSQTPVIIFNVPENISLQKVKKMVKDNTDFLADLLDITDTEYFIRFTKNDTYCKVEFFDPSIAILFVKFFRGEHWSKKVKKEIGCRYVWNDPRKGKQKRIKNHEGFEEKNRGSSEENSEE